MKKIFIFILFFLCTNVSAINCKYDIDGTVYSFDVTVESSEFWGRVTRSYSINGTVLNEKTYSEGDVVINASIQGEVPNDSINVSTCPVLAKISGSKYGLVSYDTYLNFYAPENTIYCSDCNDDVILIKPYDAPLDYGDRKVTFNEFCLFIGVDSYDNHYLYGPPVYPHYYPLLSYLHFNLDAKYINICRNYNENGDTTPFKDHFKNYDKNFVLGEINDLNVCPLVSDSNDLPEIFKCITEKTIFVEERIQNFINSCTENEMRNIQAFASGSTAPFYIKGNVSTYLNNEIKLLLGEFSDECGNAADQLYEAIDNSARVLSTYRTKEEVIGTLRYLGLESNYLSAYSLLTNVNPSVKVEKDTCKLISDPLLDVINKLLDAFRLAAIIFVVVLTIVEVYKIFASGDSSVQKKATSLITKRIVALIVILLLPFIIDLVLDLINTYVDVDSSRCVINDIK